TAYRGLSHEAHARPGETLRVHGASGGVGVAAVQLAVAHGMTVNGTAGTERGRRLVQEHGAHQVLDHTAPDYLKKLMELTGNHGADVILEMLANVNLQKDIDVVARFGRIVVIGNRGTIEINPRGTMGKDAAIFGLGLLRGLGFRAPGLRERLLRGGRSGLGGRRLGGHALGEALLERLHEVDDLGPLYLRADRGDLLALDLLVHELEHALTVLVAVLLGAEGVAGQAVDELERQLQLALLDLRRLALLDLAEAPHLVGKVHRVQHEPALRRPDEDQALLAAHDELRERDAAVRVHRVREEPIRLLAALGVEQVERDALRRGGRVELDRNRDQPERDRPGPGGVCRHRLHDSTMLPIMREGLIPPTDSAPQTTERRHLGGLTALSALVLVAVVALVTWL